MPSLALQYATEIGRRVPSPAREAAPRESESPPAAAEVAVAATGRKLQMRTVPSSHAVAKCPPPGDHRAISTELPCPRRVARRRPLGLVVELPIQPDIGAAAKLREAASCNGENIGSVDQMLTSGPYPQVAMRLPAHCTSIELTESPARLMREPFWRLTKRKNALRNLASHCRSSWPSHVLTQRRGVRARAERQLLPRSGGSSRMFRRSQLHVNPLGFVRFGAMHGTRGAVAAVAGFV